MMSTLHKFKVALNLSTDFITNVQICFFCPLKKGDKTKITQRVIFKLQPQTVKNEIFFLGNESNVISIGLTLIIKSSPHVFSRAMGLAVKKKTPKLAGKISTIVSHLSNSARP